MNESTFQTRHLVFIAILSALSIMACNSYKKEKSKATTDTVQEVSNR